MRGTAVVWLKEVRSLFTSPVPFVAMAAFFLIAGYLFFAVVGFYNAQAFQMMRSPNPDLNPTEAIFNPFFQDISFLLVLLAPVFTMRLMAEEERSRTMELLLTSPLTAWDIVFGKYLAAISIYGFMLAVTLYMPGLLEIFGNVDWKAILSAYLGLFLLGATFLSVGLFASSLTENQLIAAAIAFAILFILWLVDWASQSASAGLQEFLRWLSVSERYRSFTTGLVDTKDLIFFASLIGYFLFLSYLSVESRKWR